MYDSNVWWTHLSNGRSGTTRSDDTLHEDMMMHKYDEWTLVACYLTGWLTWRHQGALST